MHASVRGVAFGFELLLRGLGAGWRLWTGCAFKIGADEATNAGVHVPHPARSCGWGSQVPLDEDRALLTNVSALGGHDHVGPFDVAGVA